MFTIGAYSESQDSGGVLVNVAALADQSLTTQGDDIIVPDWASKLMGVFPIGATITLCQMTSPTLRKGLLLDVNPLNVGAEPLVPTPFCSRFENPLQLEPGEGLRALVAEGAAGAEQDSVLVWLGNEITALPAGEIKTVRCTSATTLTAYAWTACTLTFSQQLEAGEYALVGMKGISAGAIACRAILPGSAHRPGAIAYDAEGDKSLDIFREGRLGDWGHFRHQYPPTVEFLSVSADTAEVVYLDLVKVGA